MARKKKPNRTESDERYRDKVSTTSIRFSHEELIKLDAMARERGMKRSPFIRDAVFRGISMYEAELKQIREEKKKQVENVRKLHRMTFSCAECGTECLVKPGSEEWKMCQEFIDTQERRCIGCTSKPEWVSG